jgi:uncharacterized membrane protein YjdF
MSEVFTTSSEIAPIRFVDACPECGYSLLGSPDEGNCPECGANYDQSVMILHGAATGKHASIGNVRSRELWRFLLVPSLFVIANVIFLFDRGKLVTLRVVIVAAWILILAVSLIARWRSSRPGLIAVYLSPWGGLQKNDVAPATLPRGFFAGVVFLICLGLLGIVIARRDDSATLEGQIAILSVVMAVCAYFFIRAFKVPPRAKRLQTPAQMLEATGQHWLGTEKVLCEVSSPGRVHLQIYLLGAKQRLEIVNAEVACNDQRRVLIESLLKQWICIASLAQPAKPS